MKIIIYKTIGYFHNPSDVMGSIMKIKSTEILSNLRDIAYIETAGRNFVDLNFFQSSYGSSAIQDQKYFNFVNVVKRYVDKKYKTDLSSGNQKFGYANKRDIVLEHIRQRKPS